MVSEKLSMVSGKLQELRLAQHKKQTEVAKICGITQSMYSKIESGTLNVPSDILPTLASLYGVSIDELFGYKPGKKFVNSTERICRRLRKYGFEGHQRGKNVIIESYGYMVEVPNLEMERIMNRVFRELRKDTEKVWINLLRDGIGKILVAEYVNRDLQVK